MTFTLFSDKNRQCFLNIKDHTQVLHCKLPCKLRFTLSIFSSVPSWFQILQSQQNTKKNYLPQTHPINFNPSCMLCICCLRAL
uniref:Uncharacterized protein n=1 Tax=Anguilla anguilla TaxID=7936 RepID=A0A0E9XHK2_ANGAN